MSQSDSPAPAPVPEGKESCQRKEAEEKVFKEENVEAVESLKDVANDISYAAKSVLQTVIDNIDDKIEKQVEMEEKKNVEVEKKVVDEAVCIEKKVQPLGSGPAEVQKTISKAEDETEILPAQESSNAQTKNIDSPSTNKEKKEEITKPPDNNINEVKGNEKKETSSSKAFVEEAKVIEPMTDKTKNGPPNESAEVNKELVKETSEKNVNEEPIEERNEMKGADSDVTKENYAPKVSVELIKERDVGEESIKDTMKKDVIKEKNAEPFKVNEEKSVGEEPVKDSISIEVMTFTEKPVKVTNEKNNKAEESTNDTKKEILDEPDYHPKCLDKEDNGKKVDEKFAPTTQIKELDTQIGVQDDSLDSASVPSFPEDQTEEKNSDVEMEEGEIPFIDEKNGILEDPLDIDGMNVCVEDAPLAVDDTKTSDPIEESVIEENTIEKIEEPAQDDTADSADQDVSNDTEDIKCPEEETNTSVGNDGEETGEVLKADSGKISRSLLLVSVFFVFLAAVLALLLLDVAAIARAIKFAEPEPKPEPKPFWKNLF